MSVPITGQGRRREWSTQAQLVILVVAILIPVLAFTGVVVARIAATERANAEQDALDIARRTASAIDRELAGLQATLQTLAASPSFRTRDFESLYRQALEVRRAADSNVVVDDLDGQQLLNTRLPFGSPLPRSADREASATAVRTGQPYVSDLFTGAVAQQPLITVNVPVLLDGAAAYVVKMSLPAQRFAQILTSQGIDPAWTLAVVDRAGIIVARSRQNETFVGSAATQDLRERTAGREGVWTGRTVEGTRVLSAYARPRLADWRVAVGVPAATIEEPLRRSLWALGGFGALTLLASILLALWFGRRITGPIHRLALDARSLGRGGAVTLAQTSVREVNEVARALAAAGEELEDRARERDKAEASLVASRERFRAAVAAVSGVLWTNTAEGRMEGEQPGWSALTGQSPEQYRGFGWAEAVHPDDRAPSVAAWNEAVAERKTFVFEHRVRRRDGAWRLFSIRAIPVLERDGTVREWVGVHTDITDQRAAEDALRHLNETLEQRVSQRTAELEQAQEALRGINRNLEAIVQARMADLQAANDEIQRFAYIVSHDLRAPLVNVMGFTSELEAVRAEAERLLARVAERAPDLVAPATREALEKDLPEAIAFIRSSTQRMDRLINAILKLSREGRRVLTPEPIDMRALVEGFTTSLAHQLEAHEAELVVEDLPGLTSDRLAVEQIFANLVENAVKYLQPGRPGRIAVRGRAVGSSLRYEIEDNGRGIDSKDFERIFDLFRRAGAQDKPGEGIGLAHVRALVRRLGGTITVASVPGRGSTFTVTLPETLNVQSEAA